MCLGQTTAVGKLGFLHVAVLSHDAHASGGEGGWMHFSFFKLLLAC